MNNIYFCVCISMTHSIWDILTWSMSYILTVYLKFESTKSIFICCISQSCLGTRCSRRSQGCTMATYFSHTYTIKASHCVLMRLWGKIFFCLSMSTLLNIYPSQIERGPGWCGSVDWVSTCESKGRWFDSQSGHMLGLQARAPVGGTWEATTRWCCSPSKINK